MRVPELKLLPRFQNRTPNEPVVQPSRRNRQCARANSAKIFCHRSNGSWHLQVKHPFTFPQIHPKMNLISLSFSRHVAVLALSMVGFVDLAGITAAAAPTLAQLDDFTDAQHTSRGAGRFVVDDKAMGSHSHATQRCVNGIMTVEGELVPGRGLPSFISVPLLLAADAKAQDLTGFEGVRIRVKVIKGILTIQVASAEIQNFDFHTSGPVSGKRDEFSEVRLPFKDMKRAWSEQIPLNLKTITSVNLVAFGVARDTFAFEVDEIGFY